MDGETREASDPYALHLPNIRSLFLPDPNHALVEADLARADAQVIAWEADAHDLKAALAADIDLHSENADLLFGHVYEGGRFRRVREIEPRRMHVNGMSYRDCAKRFVHAVNFAGGSRTVASTIVVPEPHVAACQRWWTRERHPEIGRLHKRVEWELSASKNPVIFNRFGFRRVYVDGDRVGNLLGQALAWIAQSTVAVAINKALLKVDASLPEFALLLQIHDSLLGQVRRDALTDAFIARLTSAMRVVIPYDDTLVIPSEIKFSFDNWGSMKKWRNSNE